jgi:tetratricopeptide (TPR) repeat protein
LIGGAIAGLAAWWWSARPARPPAASSSGKPVVAVLYFENNTGDRALDWMRTGLTDMIVTDLSESPDFEVLGTDRLVQILQELEWPHDRPISADVVEAIAERAAVDRVLLGSYVKAGGTIRISARLQEARSGRIVSAERVEGQGEASLFGLVDELTRRVRTHLTAGRPGPPASLVERPGEASRETGLDRGLAEITTSSIEAYRYYAEGLNFHERDLPEQALPLLEKAVAVDPDFAMAYAKLAVVQNNLRAWDKRDEYARKALALTSRLTTRERYYIEGFHYSNYPETLARGIEAYRQGLKLHPEHQASRHNLGLIFILLERFPEALEQYEELVRRRVSTPTTYENLAELLVQTGDTGHAREVADDFLGRYPDSASGLRTLGASLVAAGRLEEARAAFEKAEALNPLDAGARIGRRAVALLQQRWEDVHAISDELARSPSPFSRFQSLLGEALVAQAHGRSRIALETLERAARVPGLAHQQRAAARNRMAELLLRGGRPAAALAQAERALADARRRDAEFRTLQLIAIAHAALGHAGEVAKALAQLEERAGVLPSRREIRRVHWTRGQIALERGDAAGAVAELDQAVSMLPPHGPPIGPPSSHVDLWYDAALARIRVGRDADAAPLLERIQSGHERALATDAWARSFFLLGQIAERRGDRARAREQYARFLELWRDGDVERAWVAEAARKLSAAGRPTADTRLPDAGPPRP